MCFGIFQNHYSNLPQFQHNTAKIPTIGILAQGLYYLGAPLSAMFTKRFPRYQRLQIWIGWPMCIAGLLAASFATSVDGLIATQGVMYGLGFLILTYPIISMINEWWVARKGFAFGIFSASSGGVSIVLPFIIDLLLQKYGYQITLRASAVAMLVLTAPLIPLLKARLPASDQAALARVDWQFLKVPLFWVYGLTILIRSMGFFFPGVFLPSFASLFGLSSTKGALLLSLMSIAQVLGQFAFGYLSDKSLPVSILSTSCCVAAGVASLTFWGLGKSMPPLAVFSVIYGFFGFGFTTMRVAMGQAVSDDPSTVFATYAIFVFLEGIGNILVGPLSAVLLSSKTIMRESYAAGKYDGVVILTGTSSLLAALIVVCWHSYKGVLALR